MKRHNLEFCFKGSRTYVHGTDIYNTLLEFLKNDIVQNSLDLSFHGITKTNIEISNEKPTNESLLKFACKYVDKENNKKILYGFENNVPIECRYEYPENSICTLSELNLEKQEVLLTKSSSFTFVENTVALNKYLLESLFPDVNGKWYFTRFQIKEILHNKTYPLKLIFKANFNFKLTKTEIFVDNSLIGFIYFSLV